MRETLTLEKVAKPGKMLFAFYVANDQSYHHLGHCLNVLNHPVYRDMLDL
jgi:predicted metal-dependent HD superfamily phosphohydrolase